MMSKIVILACITFIIVGVVIFQMRDNGTIESDRLIITWQRAGEPLIAQGRVVNNQKIPVIGQGLKLDNDSGGQFTVTDKNGCFRIELGEQTVTRIALQGVEKIATNLSCSKGLHIEIKIK